MKKLKDIKKSDISKFVVEHPTFPTGLKIPDSHIKEFFMPTEIQLQKIKHIFYEYMRNSLDRLIDKMDEGFEYVQALKIIKHYGYSLPLRVSRWGYQEPITVDELLDKLDKNSKHWERVFENAVERQQTVERKKKVTQKTLVDEE